MTRKTRKTLFYVLLGLFFVIGMAVVLYAQGWRLDLKTWRPEKAGGIFVRSFPSDASIFLDGKSIANQTGLLSRGTLISGLFPRTYKLDLKENGYADWHESVAVLPSLVTEFKYAVLVPKNASLVASGTVDNFSIISGEAILQTPSGAIMWRGKKIGTGSVISESINPKNIIIKSAVTGGYLLYDLDKSTSTNLSAIFPNNASIAIDPYDETKVIAGTAQKIWIFNTTQATPSTIERAPARGSLGSSIAISPSLIAWTQFMNASGTSGIVFYDKFSIAITRSSSSIPGHNLSLRWIAGNTLGVLQNDGSLYLYDTSADQFKKLADDVKDFEATDDGSMLAAIENKSLEVFSFTDANTYHRFNLPDMANVKRVLWHKDMNHLFVAYADHVSLLNLDDSGLGNFTMVARGTSPFYDADQNALYMIDPSHKLVRLDFSN